MADNEKTSSDMWNVPSDESQKFWGDLERDPLGHRQALRDMADNYNEKEDLSNIWEKIRRAPEKVVEAMTSIAETAVKNLKPIKGGPPIPSEITGGPPIPSEITGGPPIPSEITGGPPVPSEITGGPPIVPTYQKLYTPYLKQLDPKVLGPPKPKKKVLGPPKPNTFQTALIESESKGNYSVVNTEGYMGAYQFGDARLKDYKKATGEKFDNKTFIKDKKLQDKVFKWHTNDIKNYITKNKLDSYIGKKINGVLVTWNGLIAVAHLGGNTGMRKFLQSNGKYNPNDAPQNSGSVGTSLTDYLNKFKDSK